MNGANLLARLAAALPELRGRLGAETSLKDYTWFRVGGPAEVLYSPADEADLAYFMKNLPAGVPALLTEHEVPHAPVLSLDQLYEHPQIAARGMLVDPEPPPDPAYRLIGSPVHWHGEPPRQFAPPPALGEHTDAVLGELGYSSEQIAVWRTSAVIA